jgi:hypothetical protein
MKGSFTLNLAIIAIIFSLIVCPAALFADDPPTVTPATTVVRTALQLKLSADLSVGIIETHPCLCADDLKNLNVLAPKNMRVRVFNDSSLTVNAKVTVKYYSLNRENGAWKTWTRNITLNPRQTQVVTIWGNTYYDLIRRSTRITAKVEITSTNITDPDLTNNERKINECEYYIG